MTEIKPNFLIVGAAKAGTTALYYYLKQHKDIGLSHLKEPKYFSSFNLSFPHNGVGDGSVDKYAIRDWEEYLELFKDFKSHKRIGEVSPDYLFYHKQTAPFIKRKLGNIPIIIILRNPVKRAFSAYSYLKRDNREKRTFKDALTNEKSRKNKNWDFIWSYKEGGLYAEQIATYKAVFTDVKVVCFEDLVKNSLKETNEIAEFLGLHKLTNLISSKHNASGVPNNYLTRFILRRDNKISTSFREFLKNMIPRIILEKIAIKTLDKIEIKKEDEEYLKNYFKGDIEKLEKLIDRDLSNWKN